MMLGLTNHIARSFMLKRFGRVEKYMAKPAEAQDSVFKTLIANGIDSQWGRKYRYSEIKSWDDYNRLVPVNTYEDLFPYIERLLKGEQYVLYNKPVCWFSKSSGTTGSASKFIPMTREALEDCHYKGGKDMVAIYCNMFPQTRLFTGYNIALGGSRQQTPDSRIFCGDLSAILMDNLPAWAELFRFPKKEVALMGEWQRKLQLLVEATAGRNVVSLSGVPSWMSLLLQNVLEYTGKKSVSEVWPGLEVYFTGGVHFEPYQEKFRQLIASDSVNYINTYNASEGFFGVQDQTGSNDMLLLLDNGVFYEFMPLSELGKENPTIVPLEGVEKGVNYAMLISTNAGLWRYLIGDTVSFSSMAPYRVRITGRTKNFINVCGEELIVDNAIKALKDTCRRLDCEICEFSAAPYFSETGHPLGHQWVMEFEKEPEDSGLFARILDGELQRQNTDYQAKRYKDLVLGELKLVVVPRGTFYEWQKKNNRLGGQYKVPRLSNNRNIIDDLLASAKNMRK